MQRIVSAGGEEDRISQLPDEIIHLILYRLNAPRQAAETSLLSRRWLHLWGSYPVLEFVNYDWEINPGANSRRGLRKNFLDFAAASSKRLLNLFDVDDCPGRSTRSSSSESPPLSLPLHAVRILFPRWEVRKWATTLRHYKLASASPVEIEVQNGFSRQPISWDFSRTRVIKLSDFDFDAISTTSNNNKMISSSMKRLEVLHLRDVTIRSEKALALFTSLCNAPNLQSLSLISLLGLISRLDISSNSLKYLEIVDYSNCKYSLLHIHIASAPVLHSFRFGPNPQIKLTVESPASSPASSAPNLKVVTLLHIESILAQSHIDHLISNFPSLQSLSINISNYPDRRSGMKVESLRISSSELRELTVAQRADWLPLHIDAPNLVALHHSKRDAVLPEIKGGAIHLLNVTSSCRCVVDLSVDNPSRYLLSKNWFLEWREFLGGLTQSHPHLNLVLVLDRLNNLQQVISSFDSSPVTGQLPPLAVQHLKLEKTLLETPLIVQHVKSGRAVLERLNDVNKAATTLLDGFFWLCRPKLLSLTWGNYEHLSSCICEQLLMRNDIANCCDDSKCWRHQLKDVKVESNTNDDHQVEISKDLISSIAKREKITFMLAWY